LFIFIVVAAGEPLYRARFPGQLRVSALCERVGWKSRKFAFGLILGYCLAALFIAVMRFVPDSLLFTLYVATSLVFAFFFLFVTAALLSIDSSLEEMDALWEESKKKSQEAKKPK
jgi:uncharacterized protein YacL